MLIGATSIYKHVESDEIKILQMRPYKWVDSETLQMSRLWDLTNELTMRPYKWVDFETLQMSRLWDHTNESTLRPHKWFDPETTQMSQLRLQIIWLQKILTSKKNFTSKKFWHQKNFDIKKFWHQKILT